MTSRIRLVALRCYRNSVRVLVVAEWDACQLRRVYELLLTNYARFFILGDWSTGISLRGLNRGVIMNIFLRIRAERDFDKRCLRL